ncbi:PREDICTED: eukaryotic translation initiation factor 5B isoform X2 [Dinoponera quadriceps]|uniref:Eukaryotic translation initiation factor 5B isoform X2 n=1 Tax=Dinoponera quadriceps TaxID=609295 RepID=A0A6P3Y484_DINQU|nr:PREDICTED: eukaryotic translation initiation factor 5B isoform X2 [Dinoponera quadriceps]
MQESQPKKGKKARRKQNDSDDDIEKVLAELALEYSGEKPVKDKAESKPEPSEQKIDDEDKKKKGKKDKKKEKAERNDVKAEEADSSAAALETNNGQDMDVEVGTVKTAAQKKKEKKEREKQKKLAQKKAEVTKEGTKKVEDDEVIKADDKKNDKPVPEKKQDSLEVDVDVEPEDGKKKKKKGAKEEGVGAKEKGKGPGKKTIAAMQEALRKLKEEEERLKREEEERMRQEELREQARLEQLRLEQERKERKKLKEKQRKERLKAEGKFLTTKQKQDRVRAQAMIEALKAQGLDLPDVGEKKPRPGTRIRPNKLKQQVSVEKKEDEKLENNEAPADQVQMEIVDQPTEVKEKKEDDDVKDSWDADSTEDEQEEDKSDDATKTPEKTKEQPVEGTPVKAESEKKESSESEMESESGSESELEGDESDEDSEVEDKLPDAARKKERVRERIQNRRIEAEKKKSLDNLRAAVVCVLGHVDTGKTKILDKLRSTKVQDGEAGGITQQIGATNVPIADIQKSTKHVRGFADKKLKIPGLLIIDTPGHESFSNLRSRGSSLCDIAILVVDITHGLELQTLESINLLKAKKCPFVVALNKIDRLYDWQAAEELNPMDVQDIVKNQAPNTQREFEKRSKEIIVQFAEQGLNAALFYENPDPRSYVSLVPTSAITGEGMGNLLALIVDACQGPLARRLMYSEELQATVLEVKALPGLGTTIDCILVNGMLREGDTVIIAGTDGPIVTQIRSLLMPKPLKEFRVKNEFKEHREVKAAQGVKIAAKDLEKAIAGLNMQVAQKPDEVEALKEEIAKELSSALGNIRLAERGVYVQASTLGALEALLDFLKSSKIPTVDSGIAATSGQSPGKMADAQRRPAKTSREREEESESPRHSKTTRVRWDSHRTGRQEGRHEGFHHAGARQPVRHDSRVRREDREGRAGIGGLAGRQDHAGGHYLPPVRPIHRLQGGTEAAQAGRVQAHRRVPVQAEDPAAARVQLEGPDRDRRDGRGWHRQGRNAALRPEQGRLQTELSRLQCRIKISTRALSWIVDIRIFANTRWIRPRQAAYVDLRICGSSN